MSNISIIGDNITSPIGWTTEENYVSLRHGKSGLNQHFSKKLQLHHHSGIIVPSETINRFDEIGDSQKYSRLEQNSILSVKEALSSADIDPSGEEVLFIVSTTKGNINLLNPLAEAKIPRERRFLQNMAMSISQYFGNNNNPIVISNACISGVVAIITATRLLRTGPYKHIVVLGCDEVSDFTLSGFNALKALSSSPCLPFDVNRKGINLGDACATMILSNEKMGNEIEIIGGASTNDANHISGPSRDGEGMIRAIKGALNGTETKDIDFISAHGTATLFNDEMESKALKFMNLDQIPTNSFKGYWGHTLGAAGLIECIASYQSILKNTVIKSLGFQDSGTTELVNILKETSQLPIKTVLKTASGFGGCNASIVFKRKIK